MFFHTDGDVFNLIPDFIKIGVDILNPIQTSARKMANLGELKTSYVKDLVFCGAMADAVEEFGFYPLDRSGEN